MTNKARDSVKTTLLTMIGVTVSTGLFILVLSSDKFFFSSSGIASFQSQDLDDTEDEISDESSDEMTEKSASDILNKSESNKQITAKKKPSSSLSSKQNAISAARAIDENQALEDARLENLLSSYRVQDESRPVIQDRLEFELESSTIEVESQGVYFKRKNRLQDKYGEWTQEVESANTPDQDLSKLAEL